MSVEELGALTQEYLRPEGGPPLTNKLLDVLSEGAMSHHTGTSATAAAAIATADGPAVPCPSAAAGAGGSGASSSPALLTAYQQLYAAAVLGTLSAVLHAKDEVIPARLLGQLQVPGTQGSWAAEAARQLDKEGHGEVAAAAGMNGHAAHAVPSWGDQKQQQQQELREDGSYDDDDSDYEPLEPLHNLSVNSNGCGPAHAHGPPHAFASHAAERVQDLPSKLSFLSGQLRYRCMDEDAVWRSASSGGGGGSGSICGSQPMQLIIACLSALQQQPDAAELAGPLCMLGTERMAAEGVADGLGPLIRSLGECGGCFPLARPGQHAMALAPCDVCDGLRCALHSLLALTSWACARFFVLVLPHLMPRHPPGQVSRASKPYMGHPLLCSAAWPSAAPPSSLPGCLRDQHACSSGGRCMLSSCLSWPWW